MTINILMNNYKKLIKQFNEIRLIKYEKKNYITNMTNKI